MAQLIRSAKPGADWTVKELFAFNISVQNVDVPTFFGEPKLPPTTVSPVILNNLQLPPPPAVTSKEERLFYAYLHRANFHDEAAVDDFAFHILKMLDFDGDNKLIISRKELSLTMCGSRVEVMADIVVLDNMQSSLIVQEDKLSTESSDPKEQLIAAAIAEFVEENIVRVPPLLQRTFLAMTMVGPCPIFYKIPVTQSLVDAVATGQYPSKPTVVQRLQPPVPDSNQYRRYGMNPLENRRIVFQCLEALRGLL